MQKSQHTRRYRKLIEALRRARERAGLKQAEVADRMDSYASFVSKVESGERKIDVVELAEFCQVYRVDLIDLLREAGIIRDQA